MPKFKVEYDSTVYRRVDVKPGEDRPVLRIEEGKIVEIDASSMKEAREKFEIMKSGHPYRERQIKNVAKV